MITVAKVLKSKRVTIPMDLCEKYGINEGEIRMCLWCGKDLK